MSTASNIINFEYIKVGTSSYSGNADTTNVAFRKINSNFTAIANSLTNIIIPIASTGNTGTVKIGQGINVAPDGTISVGQTVHVGAPGDLTGEYGDAAGTLATDMNVLYVSTGTFSPNFAVNPNVDGSNTNVIVTTSSFIANAANAASVGYVSGTWVLYDTNYHAYPITNLTFGNFTDPVTTITIDGTVNYTSATVFYVATQDVWHRLPYINHAGKLPVSVIPYQVGNITYTGTSLITTIGTTAGDLTLQPQGDVRINAPLHIQGAISIGQDLSVSTSTAVGDYTVNPVGNIILNRPTHITSGTTIDGVLTASASLTHYVGGISLGPMMGADGEAISTNDSQQDLYVLPYGDLYIGDSGKSVTTNIFGNTNITGALSVTSDITSDTTVGAPVFRIPVPNTITYHELSNVNTNDLEIRTKNNLFVNVDGTYVDVNASVRAEAFAGTNNTAAQVPSGADTFNGVTFDGKLRIQNSSITAAATNNLVVTGGSGSTDSITVKTNNTYGTITLTASNASAVLGQGIVFKGNANNSGVDITDSVYVKSGSGAWKFDQYGRIIFPDATVQVTAFTANPTLQGLTVTNVALVHQLSVQTTATINGPLTVNNTATIAQDLNVGGNTLITGSLTVLGSSIIVNSTAIEIEDAVIDVGTGAMGASLTVNDGLNKGVALNYFDTQVSRMFVGRDASTGRFVIRDNINAGSNTVVNTDYSTHGRPADASFGSLKLLGGTAASSNTTGDLQVAGGASIQGDLYVGGTLNLTGQEIVVGGVSFQNGMTLSGSTNPASEFFTITNGNGASPVVTFQVDSSSGNTAIAGTLNVTGAGTIVGLASLQNNLNLAGDFNLAVNKFTVASLTGNTAIAGTLQVVGATTIQNALNVAGTFAINTNKFLVTGSSGNTSIAGTLGVAQNFAVAVNKFTVSSSTGNTVVAGTINVGSDATLGGALGVTGATSLSSTLSVTGGATLLSTLSVTDDLSVGAGNFTVDAQTGNIGTIGTLNVLNGTLLQSSLSVGGAAYLNSTAAVTGDFSVNTNSFKVVSTTGNTTVAGTLAVGGNTTLSGSLALANTLTIATNKFVVDSLTGNTTVAGTLGVTNATTLNSTVRVVGAATLDSTLGVAREVTLNTTTQATTLGTGALVLQGGASVAKNLFVGGDLGVTGNVSGVQGNFSGNVTDNNQRVLVNVVPSGSIGINVSNLTKTGSTVTFTVNNLGVISVANGTDTTVSATTGTNVAINVTSTLETVTGRGASSTQAITLSNATDASSTITGALKVSGGVGIGKNLYVGGNVNITGNISATNLTDNNNRVITSVTPTAGGAINISNLTSTGPAVSFTVNNLGVHSLAGTTNNVTVSQSTGSVTLNLGTVGTAGTYTYASSFTTDQFGRVLSVVANTAIGTGQVVLATSPTILSPTINNNIVLSAYTGYLYGNGSGTVTASTTLPGEVVTGTVPAAFIATKLTATQNFSVSGDVSSPTVGFNGTASVVMNTTLATVTQGAGSNFVKIALDTKGRVVGNSAVTDIDINTVLGSTAVANASNVAVQTVSDNATYYSAFVSATFGYKPNSIDTRHTYNPSTGLLTAPALVITTTTNASSTNTGALQVAGGAGIGGNLYVGGGAYIGGDLYVDGTQTFINSSNLQTGDKVFYFSTSSANASLAVNSGIAIGPTAGTYASLLFDGGTTWKSKGNINPDGTFSLGTSGTPWSTVYGTAVYDNSNRVLTTVQAGTGTQIVSIAATTVKVNIVPATNSVIGGVKGSSTINVASDGTISTISSQTNITSVGTLTSLTVQSTNASPNFTARIAGQGSGDKLAIVTSGSAGDGIQYQSLNSAETLYAPFAMNGSTMAFSTNGSGATPTLILNADGTAAFTSTLQIQNGVTIDGNDINAPAGGGTFYVNSGVTLGDGLTFRLLNPSGVINLTANSSNVVLDPNTVRISSINSNIYVDQNEVDISPIGVVNPYRFTNVGMYFPDSTQQTSAALPATVTATNVSLGYVKIGNNISAQGDGTITVTTATNLRDGVVKLGLGILASADGTISVPVPTASTGVSIVTNTMTATISIGQDVATTAAVTFGSVTSTGNVTDHGNRVITSITPTAGAGINISSLTSSGPSASFTINNLGVNSLTGTANQITASASTGAVTLSLPQNISSTATVTFGTVTSTGAITDTGNRVVTSVTPTAGTGINISSLTSTGPSTAFTINNLGVTSLTGGTYLRVSQSTGSVTLTNLGVTNILNGTGISIDANTGTVTITNTGVTTFNGASGSVFGVGSLTAGTRVAVSASTGSVTISVPDVGVTAVNGSTGSVLVVSSIATGAGISASASTGTVTLTNTGVTGFNGQTGSVTGVSAVNGSTGSVLVVSSLAAGAGITVSASTGSVTVTNAGVTAFNGSTGAVLGVGSITGTANQVTASASTGSVTLSLPQSIATSSTPQFAGLTIAGTGAVTIGSTTAGTMNNVAIGATTATTAKFTGLTVGYVSVGSATYTADANTNIIGCNRAGTIGVTLPAVAVGRMVTIKDESGNAASNVITITPASGLIEGNASYTLNINYGSVTTYCNGTNWFII